MHSTTLVLLLLMLMVAWGQRAALVAAAVARQAAPKQGPHGTRASDTTAMPETPAAHAEVAAHLKVATTPTEGPVKVVGPTAELPTDQAHARAG